MIEDRLVFARPAPAGRAPLMAFIQRHQLLAFYVLAFVISWTGILLVIGGPANFPGTREQISERFLAVMLAWLAGPSVASLLMTGAVAGRAGYRRLLARLLHWRVDIRWYAIALLTAPLVYVGLCLALSAFVSPAFASAILVTNDKTGLVVMGVAYGILGGGFLEELGWTGFAVPKLRQRRNILATGLTAGVLWGAYHFSVIYWATSPPPSGALGIAILFLQLFAWLPAYRVLMVWVYDRTQSLLLAMLMHGSLTAGMLILEPQEPLAMVGPNLLTWLVAFAAVWWIIVAAVGVATHGYAKRKSAGQTRLHRDAGGAMNVQGPLPKRVALRALISCAAATAELLANRRLHLPREHVGMWLRFPDGMSAWVFRETVVERGPTIDPCVLVVEFRLRVVRGFGHTLFRWQSLLNTPLFVGFPGFVSKLWMANDENDVYRGVYEWDGASRAEFYARCLWRVLALGCVPGSIHYQVIPGLHRDQVLADPGLLDTFPRPRTGRKFAEVAFTDLAMDVAYSRTCSRMLLTTCSSGAEVSTSRVADFRSSGSTVST